MLADMAHVLDNPVYASLSSSQHAHLVRSRGRALRYLNEVSPFMGLPDSPSAQDWADACELLDAESAAVVHGPTAFPPSVEVVDQFGVLQMTASPGAEGTEDPRAAHLSSADVPEMLDLAGRTAPGPFFTRTIDLGAYVGVRKEGELIAMAGERMVAQGWVEISAVCTSPEHQGKGLGSGLIRTLTARITRRGARPYLHVAASNTNAINLYKHLGFAIRRELTVSVLRRSDGTASDSR
jgi:ribosomal protein S18 acetylase RimI-like enzyme